MIGLFDSGSGGLTVLKKIKERAPRLDILYFGDIAHAPYGNRTREELNTLTFNGIKLLVDQGAKGVVSACNSVSASIAKPLFEKLPLDGEAIIEMAEPTVEVFSHLSQKNILLTATTATIFSRLYQDKFEEKNISLDTLAISELAGAIEKSDPEEILFEIIEKSFKEIAKSFDILILGCTHFPLVENLFAKVLKKVGRNAEIFDPANPVAEKVIERFGTEGGGSLQFLISKDSEAFRERVQSLFGNVPYTIEVIKR